MRYRAAEKLEIIRLVEQSSLPARRTLTQLGIPRATFYRWYERYLRRGAAALSDGQPAPRRVWNKLPEEVAAAVLELALKKPALSPREVAARFVDQRRYFLSEASVYRLLKARGLITSPAFILLQATARFAQPTTAPNQLWQTDFTYLRVVGWGWFYLSTVLDDFSRYIVAWKLCPSMSAGEVAETLRLALTAAGLNQAGIGQRPRLLSDNGPSYLSAQLGAWLNAITARSKTRSCSKTTICRASSKRAWPNSSASITLGVITRAWAISLPLTSISAAGQPFSTGGKRSN